MDMDIFKIVQWLEASNFCLNRIEHVLKNAKFSQVAKVKNGYAESQDPMPNKSTLQFLSSGYLARQLEARSSAMDYNFACYQMILKVFPMTDVSKYIATASLKSWSLHLWKYIFFYYMP